MWHILGRFVGQFFVLLRTAHIVGAVLWVGSAILYLFFVAPSIKASGPGGQGVMQQLIGRQRYPLYMNTVALVTILSGVYLIVVASGGLLPSWFRTGPGLGFTLGAVVGIAVFFVGMLGIKPSGERMRCCLSKCHLLSTSWSAGDSSSLR